MISKSKKSLTEGPIVSSIISLSIPIVFGNLLQSGYQLTDAFWVGKLGGIAVAAVSVSFPFIFLVLSLGMGFAMAGSILVAQYMGAKNREMVNHISAQTLLMVISISFILGALGLIFSPMLLHLMGVEQSVYTSALGFLRVSFLGIVSVFSFFTFQAILRGIGEVMLPIYIVLGTMLLNFVLDPLFIFGSGIIPAFGVAGAAWATFGTQTIAMIIGFVILFRGNYGIKLNLKNFIPDFSFIKKSFLLGFPSSIEMSTRALGALVMTFLVSSFGTFTVAAYGIGSNILQIIIIPAMGLAMSTATLVGQNIGAKKIDRACKIGKLSALIAVIFLSGLGVLVFSFAPYIVKFFVSNDDVVVGIGTTFLRFLTFAFPFMGIQFAFSGVLRGSGSMTTTMMISLISQWVIQFPVAYILSKHTTLGIKGLWLAFPITFFLTSIITLIYFLRGNWKRVKLIDNKEQKLQKKIAIESIIEEGIRQ